MNNNGKKNSLFTREHIKGGKIIKKISKGDIHKLREAKMRFREMKHFPKIKNLHSFKKRFSHFENKLRDEMKKEFRGMDKELKGGFKFPSLRMINGIKTRKKRHREMKKRYSHLFKPSNKKYFRTETFNEEYTNE